MKLSDYFDKIFIIGALDSERVNHTITTLKKLNLYDDNVFVHLYTPLDKLNISVNIPNDVNWREPNRISLTLAHYTIIKHSYNAGLNRVLILEDDNYFLNNIDSWKKVLTTMPTDWDVMKFVGFCFSFRIKLHECLIQNGIFRKIDSNIDDISSWGWGASAIAFNRKSMKILIDNQETKFNMSDDVIGIYRFPEGVSMDVNIYICLQYHYLYQLMMLRKHISVDGMLTIIKKIIFNYEVIRLFR